MSNMFVELWSRYLVLISFKNKKKILNIFNWSINDDYFVCIIKHFNIYSSKKRTQVLVCKNSYIVIFNINGYASYFNYIMSTKKDFIWEV